MGQFDSRGYSRWRNTGVHEAKTARIKAWILGAKPRARQAKDNANKVPIGSSDGYGTFPMELPTITAFKGLNFNRELLLG